MFATTFTITILGVSLAVIARDLSSSAETVAWVITGPMLVQALALPVLGGEHRNRRRRPRQEQRPRSSVGALLAEPYPRRR